MESVSSGQKKEMKQRRADDSNQKKNSELTKSGVITCLPTIDFVSSEQANCKTKREELQSRIPRRARHASKNQRAGRCLSMSMCGPASIDPVANGQMICRHDSRTDLVRINRQYQDYQMFADSCTTMTWGNGNLHFSHAEMSRPIQSARQKGIQETQMPIMKRSHGDIELEFPIITNVRRRAMISNMMSPIHTSKRPFLHPEEFRSSGEHRRWSAPECLETSKQERFPAMYEAQEVDISDSDVVSMWLSSKVEEDDYD
jgi:hypothetical protein